MLYPTLWTSPWHIVGHMKLFWKTGATTGQHIITVTAVLKLSESPLGSSTDRLDSRVWENSYWWTAGSGRMPPDPSGSTGCGSPRASPHSRKWCCVSLAGPAADPGAPSLGNSARWCSWESGRTPSLWKSSHPWCAALYWGIRQSTRDLYSASIYWLIQYQPVTTLGNQQGFLFILHNLSSTFSKILDFLSIL